MLMTRPLKMARMVMPAVAIAVRKVVLARLLLRPRRLRVRALQAF